MPALFAAQSGASATELQPLAQLGAGPDGTSLLARKGEQLVELMQLSFGPGSPQWTQLEGRLRSIAAVDHPAVRQVLSIEAAPPTVTIEGDSTPLLAEVIELRAPNRFVRTDAVEENDWRPFGAARLGITDLIASAGSDPGHRFILAARLQAR